MEDLITDLANGTAKKINSEKERLLKERLTEIIGVMGIEINLEKELQRTFPRIACKYSKVNHSETWLFNDGTEFGREIITFYPLDTVFEKLDIESWKFTIGFKYK